jgi:hypothetical protein
MFYIFIIPIITIITIITTTLGIIVIVIIVIIRILCSWCKRRVEIWCLSKETMPHSAAWLPASSGPAMPRRAGCLTQSAPSVAFCEQRAKYHRQVGFQPEVLIFQVQWSFGWCFKRFPFGK